MEESVIHKLKDLDIDELGRLVDVSMSITGTKLMHHEYHWNHVPQPQCD